MAPGPAGRPEVSRWEMLSPLRPADSCASGPKLAARAVGDPGLPRGCGVRYLLRRVDPKRSCGQGPTDARALGSAALATPLLGSSDRHSARTRARSTGGASDGTRNPEEARARGVLESLSVSHPRRHGASSLRLLSSLSHRSGVLRRFADGPGVAVPGMPAAPATHPGVGSQGCRKDAVRLPLQM